MKFFVEEATGHNSKGLGSHRYLNVTNQPFPCVSANRPVKCYIQSDNKPMKQENKPPYKVPSMSEIEAIKWNGYNVVSTFSGCGGSCLGYRMAGYRVLWANEFVPAAQESYKANHKKSILDKRDIRIIKPEEILQSIGMKAGELDILDGSPPCSAFSTAGKREKGWGEVKKYSDTKQRVDDLFFEYVRILKGLQPKIFIAENVSGLVKGTAKGYFKIILQELKECGYTVKASLLDAQWLGVPQMRQRIIFIGVRNDLNCEAVYPKPLNYRYSVKDALFSLENFIEKESSMEGYAVGKEWEILKQGEQSKKYFNLVKQSFDVPSSTITTRGGDNTAASVTHPTEKRKFTIAELKRICAFPDDFILKGSYAQQWERLGRAVPPVMMYHIAKTVKDKILCHLD